MHVTPKLVWHIPNFAVTYERHPLSALFAPFDLKGRDFLDLAADIQIRGLEQEIVLFQGMILDGWNRYQASLKADVKPRFVEYDGDDPWGYVASLNIFRRHWSPADKAALYLRKLEMDQDQDQVLQTGHPSLPDPQAYNIVHSSATAPECLKLNTPSVRHIAKELGVSQGTASKIATVAQSAAPEVRQAVKNKTLPLATAAEISKLPVKEQSAAVNAPRAPKVKTAAVAKSAQTASASDLEQLRAELDEAHQDIVELDHELIAQQKLIASLQNTNRANEIISLQGKMEAAYKHINQLNVTRAEAEKHARGVTGLLEKIRKFLGVKRNSEIIEAIKLLKEGQPA